MKIILTIQLILFFDLAYSKTVKPEDYNSKDHLKIQEMVTNIVYEELYKRLYRIKPKKKVEPKKSSLNQGRRGKMIIEEMKQRNREKLAIMRGVDPSKVKKGSDIVSAQKKDNKEILKKYKKLREEGEFSALDKSQIDELKKKVMVDHRLWRKKHLPTIKEWEEKREKYLAQIDDYKKTLIDIPLVLPVTKEDQNKKVEIKIDKEFQIVGNSFAVGVRDQRQRPTCSAFAGIRAIEILLAQNKYNENLSEQYFYWASKSDCQSRKCTTRGSWVGHGLKFSKEAISVDIPREKSCLYNAKTINNNETQIPMKKSCSDGVVQVQDYSYTKTLDDIIDSLDRNKPVIVGMKLTPNFYQNKGLILASEKNKGPKMDYHSIGHTALIIGYMKLPNVFDEGSVCFLTTNSWGIGWGYGGHACISEKWLLEQRNRNPFVSINRVNYTE